MIYGITYSDGNMTRSKDLCVESMLKHGVDDTDDNIVLDYNFSAFNSEILNSKRGCGYWLWKPYVIDKAIRRLHDGDILIYADAGIEFIADVSEIISRMDQDIFFFTNGFPHVEWCKRDVINPICEDKIYRGHGSFDFRAVTYYAQVQASVIFFKVNDNTRNFVKEWLLWCQMPGFIDDSPSKLPNYPTFAEHRHDQAILTCMQIKYNYAVHFWPTPYSEHIRHTALPEDSYPTMFNHHRKRDPGKGDGQPEW